MNMKSNAVSLFCFTVFMSFGVVFHCSAQLNNDLLSPPIIDPIASTSIITHITGHKTAYSGILLNNKTLVSINSLTNWSCDLRCVNHVTNLHCFAAYDAGNNVSACSPLTLCYSRPAPHSVLLANVDYSPYNAGSLNLLACLTNAGVHVDFVNIVQDGAVAAMLHKHHYDQVWVYDLRPFTPDNFITDWMAIADWYLAKTNCAIICDARIFSSFWPPHHLIEGQRLAENYYQNMVHYQAGLVLATDHDDYPYGINTVNGLIGLNPFIGHFNLYKIPINESHPLMTYPNDMGTELMDHSTPGQCPFGFSPTIACFILSPGTMATSIRPGFQRQSAASRGLT